MTRTTGSTIRPISTATSSATRTAIIQAPVPDSAPGNIGTAMTMGIAKITPQDGSDYLDDVTNYLYSNDCNPTLGEGTSFAKQNIITYTIGFDLTDDSKLLYRAAVSGGGEHFTAKNYSALKEAFNQIMSAIVERNSCFVAPVVPVSRMNRTYAGNKIYLGFFKPQQEGNWYGNIKRYKVENDGTITDSKGQAATNSDGLILDQARSWWTTLGDDGPAVEKGGAAERLGIQIGSEYPQYLYLCGKPGTADGCLQRLRHRQHRHHQLDAGSEHGVGPEQII